tara:strand:+ start:1037 stop:2194 length:1158 start_codon:yes stop_codon:yes gene_type:complete
MNILVCDGRSRASLQIIRSLAAKNHTIFVGEAFFCTSFLSNRIFDKVYYPDPDKNADMFFDFICKYIRTKKIDFLIPVRDSSVKIFSKRKDELPFNCKVSCPDYKKMNILNNKAELVKLAKSLNIPHPKTVSLENFADEKAVKAQLDFPIIAKPVHSSGSRGIKLINDNKDLNSFLEDKKVNNSSYILQEFIPHGGALGFYSFSSKGEIKSSNIHIRIREYPHSGGPSTLRRSGEHKLVEKLSIKLLKSVEWEGVSMVEFRIHKGNNLPYLMEVNTRFWGSLAVDIHSGVDFPSHVVDFSLGKKIDKVKPKIVKVRWLFLGDILWLITHPFKIKALKEFFKFKGQKFDIFDPSDPLPVIGTLIEGISSLTKKERRQHAFGRGWNG